jgi:hypothetical protein
MAARNRSYFTGEKQKPKCLLTQALMKNFIIGEAGIVKPCRIDPRVFSKRNIAKKPAGS